MSSPSANTATSTNNPATLESVLGDPENVNHYDEHDKITEIVSYLKSKEIGQLAHLSGLSPEEFGTLMKGITPEGRRNRVHKLLAPYITPPTVPANPNAVWLGEHQQKLLTTVNFYTMGQNGEDLSMFGREQQVAEVVHVFETFRLHDKMQVVLISSSRGMGKTLFCKKICLSDNTLFKKAREIGRIIPIECDNANILLEDKLYDLFWSRLMVSHMTSLFDGTWFNHTRFGTLQFRRLGLSEVAMLSTLGNSNFDSWAKHFARASCKETGEELISLTNRLFGTQDETHPIFVLDNAHQFAEHQTNVPSRDNGFHTVLSYLLTVLSSWWCFCLVAGTTDKDLQKMNGFSNFLVCHIYLTGIGRRYWNDIGHELITKFNQQNGTAVIWKHLDMSNTRDFGHGDVDVDECVDVDVETADEDTGDVVDGDGIVVDGNGDVVHGDVVHGDVVHGDVVHGDVVHGDVVHGNVVHGDVVHGDVAHVNVMDVTSTMQADALFAKDDNSALLGMIYHGAGIPQFIRLAFKAWYDGKRKGSSVMSITEEYESSVRSYYSDACKKILSFSSSEFAELLMACSVNYFPYDDDWLLPSKFRFRDLVNQAVIFPYRVKKEKGTGKQTCSFTIPRVLFDSADSRRGDNVATHWGAVKEELNKRVPNLLWDHLFPSFTSWWNASLNLRDLGDIWENVLASAIAVCYYLHAQCRPEIGPWHKFSEIYQLPLTARGAAVLGSFEVDLSGGISHPQQQTTPTTSPLSNTIHLNSNIPHAHHDIVLCSRPIVAAIQAKSTTSKPVTAAIVKQVGQHVLLWAYPGCGEDYGELPSDFRSEKVKQKLAENKLAFLSGAACVSALNMDFILLMKGLAEGVHTSIKKRKLAEH